METSAGFGPAQLAVADSRLALAVLNHLRYQALNRVFGASREQANVLTAVLLIGAADGAYEAVRRIGGMRLYPSGGTTAFGALALREAALGIAGPSTRQVPQAGTLLALGIVGGLAAPTLRRTAQRLRAAEDRVRHERIRRYVAARERIRASAGSRSTPPEPTRAPAPNGA
jgi:hypothetical protein